MLEFSPGVLEQLKERAPKLMIADTTLRDGEQTAGVVFANPEKLHIAKLLDYIGVHQIEAGIPIMGGYEKEAIKEIAHADLKASIMGWNRPVIRDINCSLDCDVDSVAISISCSDIQIETKLHSDRDSVLLMLSKAVEYAKKHDLYVSVSAEDASRANPDYLVRFAKAAKDAGADRLRYCDTIGILDPLQIYTRVKWLIQQIDMEVEMHTHNDFGMATANAIAGALAGANYIGVTINGLGERAGNASLEEVVMALKSLYGVDIGIKTQFFREMSEYVAHASGRILPSWKAIVGTNVFSHESGIHADGILKNAANYEPFSPEEVGLTRQIVIGKHSGTKSLISKFQEYGISLDDDTAACLLEKVRTTAVELKRPLGMKDLMYLYEDFNKKHIEKAGD